MPKSCCASRIPTPVQKKVEVDILSFRNRVTTRDKHIPRLESGNKMEIHAVEAEDVSKNVNILCPQRCWQDLGHCALGLYGNV
jgi:hypothetical protein